MTGNNNDSRGTPPPPAARVFMCPAGNFRAAAEKLRATEEAGEVEESTTRCRGRKGCPPRKNTTTGVDQFANQRHG